MKLTAKEVFEVSKLYIYRILDEVYQEALKVLQV